jgi:transmembrane protein EpsG
VGPITDHSSDKGDEVIYLEVIALISSIAYGIDLVKRSLLFSRKEIEFLLCTLLVLALGIFSGLRYDVGRDYLSYLGTVAHGTYANIAVTGEPYELGYKAIAALVYKTGINPYSLFFIFGFLISGFLVVGITRKSTNSWFSFFLFFTDGFILSSFNIMRQFLAVVIFLVAVNAICNKKIFQYFFLIIIASLIHRSAIFLLPMYLLLQLRIGRKIGLALLLISIVLGRVIQDLPLNIFFAMLGNYDHYSDLVKQQLSSDISVVAMLKMAIIVVTYISIDMKSAEYIEIRPFFNCFLLYTCVTMVFSKAWIIMRFTEYIKIAGIIFIPWFCNSIKNKKIRLLATIGLCLAFLVLFCKNIFFSSSIEKYAYQWILPF